ncbi:type 1 glutamine amidotransferase [Thermoproteota archaeon]
MKRVLIIQNDKPETLGLYEKYLKENTHLTLIHAYKMKTEDKFPSVQEFTHFIIGPTPISANDALNHEFLRKEWKYIQDIVHSGKPCLGICCGGQMLAKILGGEVKRSPSKEIGGYTVKLTDEGLRDSLFKDFPQNIPVFHWHSEMFTIPPDGDLLAKGDPCPIQAFSKDNIRGIIFHLEITSEEAERWVQAYPEELKTIKKTVAQVLQECRENEKQMTQLSDKLMKNFLSL